MTTLSPTQSQAAQADRALAALIARDPTRRPDPATEVAIRLWAEDRLGSIRLAPWLRLWTAVHGRFEEGWLPDSYLARHVLPVLQGAAGRRLGASRTLMRRILGTTGMMADRAYRVRGFWLDRAGRPLPENRIAAAAFGRSKTALLRRDGAPRGQALARIGRDCFARETSLPGDLTVIGLGTPDPALAALAPGAVPLLRLVTLKPAGEPARLAGSLLRLPLGDAALPRPGAEIALPLDAATGRVSGPGLMPDWSRIARHPASGRSFEGHDLPGHAAAVEACRALHDRVPHLTLIAWEVMAEARPRLIDWDLVAPETGALQALSGPVFAGLGWEEMARAAMPEAAPRAALPAAPARPRLVLVPDAAPDSARQPVVEPAPVPEPVPLSVPAAASPPTPPEPVRPRRVILPRALRRRA